MYPSSLPPLLRSEVNDSSLAGIDQFHHYVWAVCAPGLYSPILPTSYPWITSQITLPVPCSAKQKVIVPEEVLNGH